MGQNWNLALVWQCSNPVPAKLAKHISFAINLMALSRNWHILTKKALKIHFTQFGTNLQKLSKVDFEAFNGRNVDKYGSMMETDAIGICLSKNISQPDQLLQS